MHPQVIDDITGWDVRDVACGNTHTIVSADETVITWGPSPTYGELGYGSSDPKVGKSSTRAKEVVSLKGAVALAVKAGYGHSLAIIDASHKKSIQLLEESLVFDPAEVGDKQEGQDAKRQKQV